VANMLKKMKQAATMQRQMKKVQKMLAKQTVEISSNDGLVTVIASGDMAVKSIKIDQEKLDLDKLTRLERTLASTVNSALDSAKKMAGGQMGKMSADLGLGDLQGLFG